MSRQSQTADFPSSDWFIGAVKSNPEGLLLLAAGCALLLRKGSSGGTANRRGAGGKAHPQGGQPGRQQGASSRKDSESGWGVGENISQMAEGATEYASDLSEKITESAGSYASSVSDYAQEARRTMSEGSAHLGRQAQTTLQQTMNRVVREQPLAVALAGLAAGAVVAAAFPATDLEKRTLGEAGEQLAEVADRAGERFKDATAQAGERLAEVAQERGLSSDGLKEAARDVAGAFGTAFAGETQNAQSGSQASAASDSSRSQTSGKSQAGQPRGDEGFASRPGSGVSGDDPFKPSTKRGE